MRDNPSYIENLLKGIWRTDVSKKARQGVPRVPRRLRGGCEIRRKKGGGEISLRPEGGT